MVFLQAAGGETGMIGVLLPFILMFAIFYFVLLRPQQRQQKQRRAMLDNLKKGDKIVTVGGIHGEVIDLKEDVVTVRIGEKTEIRLNRSGVGQIKGSS